jgi:hypothetical protein
MPDGSENVPVEQVIALVARDMNELAILQNQSTVPAPPPYNAVPAPPSSPRYPDQFKSLSSPRAPLLSPRTPSLFEMQKMGYGHRSVHVGGPHGRPRLSLVNAKDEASTISSPIEEPPSPSPLISSFPRQSAISSQPLTPLTARWPKSALDTGDDQAQVSKCYLIFKYLCG